MFQLTEIEYQPLKSQIATSKKGRDGSRFLPYVFTEHAALMLESVLDSAIAINASIEAVRAFIHFGRMQVSIDNLARKLDAIEDRPSCMK